MAHTKPHGLPAGSKVDHGPKDNPDRSNNQRSNLTVTGPIQADGGRR